MTRRERIENKIARRESWAQSRTKEAAQRFEGARKIADAIPFGQPILVGHHSEKHARRDQDRIHNNMSKGCEAQDMAQHHTSVAGNLAHALKVSVFSDDHDAVEALQGRIDANVSKRERMALINKLFRKGDAAGLAALGLDLAKLQATVARFEPYMDKQPYAKYELSNLGGCIGKDRKRLEFLKLQKQRAAAAEASPDGVTFEVIGEYVRVTFAEKPEREILDALRAASFHWGAGSWAGRSDALPAIVRNLVPASLAVAVCGHAQVTEQAGAAEVIREREEAQACDACGGSENHIVGCLACCRDCGRPCAFEKNDEAFHVD